MAMSTMKSIFIATALAVVLYVSGFFVILTPLPLLYVAFWRGRQAFALSSVFAAAVIVLMYALMLGNVGASKVGSYLPLPMIDFARLLPHAVVGIFGVGYFLYFAAIGAVLSDGMGKGWSILRLGGLSIFAGMFVLACTAGLSVAMDSGGGLVSEFRGYIGFVLNEVIEINKAAGAGSTYLDLISDKSEAIAGFTVRILPALAFVYTLIAAAANFFVGRRILRNRVTATDRQMFSKFRLPDYLVWPVIASGAAFFATKYLAESALVEVLAINGLVAFLALYFFQGMAIIAFMLKRVKTAFMRTLAYILIIMFFQSASVVIVMLGIADVWVNFRMRLARFSNSN